MKDRIVRTEQGKVRGIFGSDPRVKVFRGIPYAKPPIGDLRWKSPVPCEAWEGIRDCSTYGPIAMQDVPGSDPNDFWTRELHPCGPEFEMSEDCLYLNVYTPSRTGDEGLPVFVYIHGGGLQGGYPFEQEFDWEHIAARGIVVVTMAYRLGIFGFFTHPDLSRENPDGPKGNYGLQDQTLALHWVRKNISAFGGDPDKVTIGGQSAGSRSVQSQLTTPFSKGLFRAAIIQSGIVTPFHDTTDPRTVRTLSGQEEMGREFLERAGIRSIEEARKTDAAELMKMARDLYHGRLRFQLVTDGVYLPESYEDALKHGNWHDVPVIAGYNTGEVASFNRMVSSLPQNMEEFAAFAEKFGDRAEEFKALAQVRTNEDVEKLFSSETFMRLPVSAVYGGRTLSSQDRKVWIYEFNADMPGDEDRSAFHGAELWFAYDALARAWRPFEGSHYDLACTVSSYWVNFIKSGDPNGTDARGNLLPEWESFTQDRERRMYFRDGAEMVDCEVSALADFRIRSEMER